MQLEFINDGDVVRLHPDSHAAILAEPPWERHAIFHAVCQQMFQQQRPHGAAGACPLGAQGFEVHRNCLDVSDGRVNAAITQSLESLGPEGGAHGPASPGGADMVVRVPMSSALTDLLRPALNQIMSDTVVSAMESYFGSYFRIYSSIVYRTHAFADGQVPQAQDSSNLHPSFTWHRDTAPMAQVHLMAYLTDSGPESGATLFLDLAQTTRAASLGYHYEAFEDRLIEMDSVFAQVDLVPTVNCPDLQAGDAVSFAAPRLLHKGRFPLRGYRDSFTLVLLPSMTPWDQDISMYGDAHIFENITSATLNTDPFESLCPLIDAEAGRELPRRNQWVYAGGLMPYT